MNTTLAGKITLVTGGSTGIGLATAQELAAQGAKVYITGRRQAELDAARADIGAAAVAIRADVSRMADLDAVYAQIAKEEGRLDILFANAGGGDMLPLGAITEEQFDRIFATNVRGVLFTVQKALPLLSSGSSIILTGSTVSIKGTANFSVYSASKAAVRNFARSWALDLQGRGIRVNVVSPGPVKTPGLGDLVPEESRGVSGVRCRQLYKRHGAVCRWRDGANLAVTPAAYASVSGCGLKRLRPFASFSCQRAAVAEVAAIGQAAITGEIGFA